MKSVTGKNIQRRGNLVHLCIDGMKIVKRRSKKNSGQLFCCIHFWVCLSIIIATVGWLCFLKRLLTTDAVRVQFLRRNLKSSHTARFIKVGYFTIYTHTPIYIFTNNCTIIRYNNRHVVNLLHVSAFVSHLQGGVHPWRFKQPQATHGMYNYTCHFVTPTLYRCIQ